MRSLQRTSSRTAAAASAGIVLATAFFFRLPSARPSDGNVRRDRASRYPLTEKREVRKSWPLAGPSAPKDVSLDNIFGPIRVEGGNVASVELEAVETFLARTPEKLAQAKQDVRLEAAAKGNSVEIYVDGPFRCQTEGGRGVNWRDRGYEVHYDFKLKVPHRTNLVLRTVTDGDILVDGVEGRHEVHNVNGRIELRNVAGGVQAHTVNGGVRADFTRPPGEACTFKTINGNLELAFPQTPAADFQVRVTNGHVYSDFEVTPLPGSVQAKTERRKEGFFYRSKGYSRFRIGKGGPEMTLETMNGDIVIGKAAH